ncbi:hypothetical protein Tco_0300842 [Tanacetum coccineum]
MKKRSPYDKRNFTVFFHFKNNKIYREGEFTNFNEHISAIPIGYWNDLSANLTLILVGFRVLRDSLAYREYNMRLMLAPRSAKASHKKALLKLHGMRKLSIVWQNFHRLGKRLKFVQACVGLSLTGFGSLGLDCGVGSLSSSSLSKLIGVSESWFDPFGLIGGIVDLPLLEIRHLPTVLRLALFDKAWIIYPFWVRVSVS